MSPRQRGNHSANAAAVAPPRLREMTSSWRNMWRLQRTRQYERTSGDCKRARTASDPWAGKVGRVPVDVFFVFLLGRHNRRNLDMFQFAQLSYIPAVITLYFTPVCQICFSFFIINCIKFKPDPRKKRARRHPYLLSPKCDKKR